MKILTDLQACQSLPHKNRGIGRYSLSLAAEVGRQRGEHELYVALNAAIPRSIESVRAVLPADTDFAIWSGIRKTSWERAENEMRREAGNMVREAAFAAWGADIHHISSFFEGYADDVVVDIPHVRRVPVAVTLYDLIPLLYQDTYLPDERMKRWYLSRVEALKRADLLMTISECTRRDAIEHLGMDPSRIINISAAVDPMFRVGRPTPGVEAVLRERYGLSGRILLYTGGIDDRKNIGRLIEAFSQVEPAIRSGVQLVIVCGINGEAARALRAHAAAMGLAREDLVLTGYVSDKDLVALYNVCEAFVFPSWYEGFGLPVLEAIACGAAVIASDRASVPEVVGLSDALFNPFNTQEMAARITEVLANAGFRETLREHARIQARRFSWEASATCALQAMAETVQRAARPASVTVGDTVDRKPSLAFVAPLPPEKTGIANYCSELLPCLAQHYRIQLITDQAEVEPAAAWSALEVHDVAWFKEHAGSFDRILYHFGNSPFHGHMFELLEQFGGVVVLHDFYLSGGVSHFQLASKVPGFWSEYLYLSHGYRALIDLESGVDLEDMLLRYPCNAPVIENADGVIVHSQHSRDLAKNFYGRNAAADWSVVPLLKTLPEQSSKLQARDEVGISADDFVICSFGILGEEKLNKRLLEAWHASSLASDDRCRLIFVGAAHDPEFDATLRSQIASGIGSSRVKITGYASSEDYRRYLLATDVAVQLRQYSRGETSAAVFDCLAHGVPTVVNAHGSMKELDPGSVVLLRDDFDSMALTKALEALRAAPLERARLAEAGVRYCRDHLDPGDIACQYGRAIEHAYLNSATQGVRDAGAQLAQTWSAISEDDRCAVAEAMAANLPVRLGIKQMLVDVTELTRRDAKSGIQRVVRSVASWLLKSQSVGYRVELVYSDPKGGYRYARKFCSEFLKLEPLRVADEPVTVREGDVFIGLDLALEEIPANVDHLQHMRDRGAFVYVVVYDLLPLMRNDCFPAHAEPLFRNWLTSVSTVADGAICISRAVADDLVRELDGMGVERVRPLEVSFFHLGGDIEESLPSRGVTKTEQAMIDCLAGVPSFLMVGTIEPRKGHSQSLDAFELLWKQGGNQRLVIVGKPGWLTEPLVERFRTHPEFGRRLLWFEDATDEALDRLYKQCSALLAASEGEGFGLPLIEAARHGLPILARDLPVFREVAGANASYFHGYDASDLADAVRHWCRLDSQERAPGSSALRWVTWKQSAEMLVGAAVGAGPRIHWLPSARRYIPMHDTRHDVLMGRRVRGSILLPERPGLVVQMHSIVLPAGAHRLSLAGVMHGPGDLQVDVAGETFTLSLGPEEIPNEAVCIAAAATRLLHLANDCNELSIAIRSDGHVRGAISALVFDPVMPDHHHDAVGRSEQDALSFSE